MDNPQPVAVRALQLHTHDGQEYQEGDEYQAHPDHVESLIVQGKAELVQPDAPKAPKVAKGSTAVEPMSTENVNVAAEAPKASKRGAKAPKPKAAPKASKAAGAKAPRKKA